MTRAGERPLRRIVQALQQDMVVEVRGEFLTLRPLGSRRGGKAEVAVKWVTVYAIGIQPKRRRTGR